MYFVISVFEKRLRQINIFLPISTLAAVHVLSLVKHKDNITGSHCGRGVLRFQVYICMAFLLCFVLYVDGATKRSSRRPCLLWGVVLRGGVRSFQ